MLPGKYENEDGTIFDAAEWLTLYRVYKEIEREKKEHADAHKQLQRRRR